MLYTSHPSEQCEGCEKRPTHQDSENGVLCCECWEAETDDSVKRIMERNPGGIQEYDPNVNWGVHTIEVTFMRWGHSVTRTSETVGNCKGMHLLEGAIGSIYDALPEVDYGIKCITLVNADGETLTCEDDEKKGEDWLAEMAVCSKFTKHEKE